MLRTSSRFGSAPHATTATSRGHAVAALGLDVAQHRFAFETVQALAEEQRDAVLLEISGDPCARLRIEITIQQIGVPMHHADFEFHLAQAGRDFAGQQSAADDDDGFFQAGHFAQGQRVPRRPQINHVAQADASHGRPDGATPHGETRLVEFDRLAVPHDREAAIDI